MRVRRQSVLLPLLVLVGLDGCEGCEDAPPGLVRERPGPEDAGDAEAPPWDARGGDDAGDAEVPSRDAGDGGDAGDAGAWPDGHTCADRTRDADGDGLPDCAEALRSTDPEVPDTDGNGLRDSQVVPGETVTLRAPFARTPPEVRLAGAPVPVTCEGDCRLVVPAGVAPGRLPVEVDGLV